MKATLTVMPTDQSLKTARLDPPEGTTSTTSFHWCCLPYTAHVNKVIKLIREEEDHVFVTDEEPHIDDPLIEYVGVMLHYPPPRPPTKPPPKISIVIHNVNEVVCF